MPRVTTITGSDVRAHIGIYSHSVKTEKRLAGQYEFDVSSFRDPAGQKQFDKGSCGTDPDIRDWVGQDRRVPAVIKECLLLAEDLIRPKKDGKSVCEWLSISFKDHHGRWIAPAVAELVANSLSDAGFTLIVHHSEVKETRKNA